MKYKIANGDVLDILKKVPDNRYHGLFCDPPYGYNFMGHNWDGSVPDSSVWAEVLRVLKPGAHGLVFGGTRTFHRLAVNLEDAGFEIRDTLMWVYGSGFPKSHNISKALDKKAGAEREVVGYKETSSYPDSDGVAHYKNRAKSEGSQVATSGMPAITAPATQAAIDWDGYGTALKPAWEPVILVRKPLDGTVVNNVLEYGCGGLNIDGCRVPASADDDGVNRARKTGTSDTVGDFGFHREGASKHTAPGETGRFPANLIHDGSGDVVAGFSDGADRFFYSAKAGKKEKNAGLDEKNPHPTVKPLSLNEYLARLILPPESVEDRSLIVPFSGVGSEAIGALLAGWDRVNGIELDEEYVEIANKRIAHWLDERKSA